MSRWRFESPARLHRNLDAAGAKQTTRLGGRASRPYAFVEELTVRLVHGVEVGQIVALMVMLLALSGWRKTESFMKFSTAANAGLVAVGFLLLMMRAS